MNVFPKISIITITYNAEKFIEKTIMSVSEQSYENIEYIIIDGNSTDETLKIIDKYSKYVDILVSEGDNGIYDAMNKGLEKITGNWVNFLNAGDTFYNSDILSKLFSNVDENCSLIYGDWYNINQKGSIRYIKAMPELSLKTLKKHFQMNHQSLFVKYNNLPSYQSDRYQIKADYQWVIDIVKKLKKKSIVYINEPLVYYDIEGISAKYILQNLKEYVYLTYVNFGLLQILLNSPIYLKYIIKYILSKTIK